MLQWTTQWSSDNVARSDFQRISVAVGGRFSPSVIFDLVLVALLVWLAASRGALAAVSCSRGVTVSYRAIPKSATRSRSGHSDGSTGSADVKSQFPSNAQVCVCVCGLSVCACVCACGPVVLDLVDKVLQSDMVPKHSSWQAKYLCFFVLGDNRHNMCCHCCDARLALCSGRWSW